MSHRKVARGLLLRRAALVPPIYWQKEPSEKIDLGTTRVRFMHKGKTYRGVASVGIRFAPDERLVFAVPNKDRNPFGLAMTMLKDWDGKLRLTSRRVAIDAIYLGTADDTLTFVPKMSAVSTTPPSTKLATAIFHLFNFPDFVSSQDYRIAAGHGPLAGWTRCGRIALAAEGWTVTIAATKDTDSLCKALHRQGGFAITHVGRIERNDGSLFSSKQLEDFLICLHYFLSFALGRWAGIALPIGFDRRGKRLFEQWGTPRMSSGAWGGSCSWFDAHHGGLLTETFPGFVVLWRNEPWRTAIPKALYWYLAANERGTGIGVDTGLILAQAALELLAWTYCVEHRKMISSKAFEPRGLSAADKLRLLAAGVNLPLAVPPQMSALHAMRGAKWKDAMDAITDIRNALVHPGTKKQFPDGSYYEAWSLSLWYVDLVCLHLCGHRGSYANRLARRWVGQVEPVPYVPASTT